MPVKIEPNSNRGGRWQHLHTFTLLKALSLQVVSSHSCFFEVNLRSGIPNWTMTMLSSSFYLLGTSFLEQLFVGGFGGAASCTEFSAEMSSHV
jgi:hypothetical protein